MRRKLSWKSIRAIRSAAGYLDVGTSRPRLMHCPRGLKAELARKHGVTAAVITQILNGQSYREADVAPMKLSTIKRQRARTKRRTKQKE